MVDMDRTDEDTEAMDSAEFVKRLRDDVLAWPEADDASRQYGTPQRALLDFRFLDGTEYLITVERRA